MIFDKNFRRDCTNNTASENKIDQMLQEFEINKQQQILNDLKKNPQKQIKQNLEDESKKLEEWKEQVKPNQALEKIMKAIKIESKTSKCIALLKTLFKNHILELHPAHILQTVYLLTDIPLNYRRQDDLKYLIVIFNIIIEKYEHCVLSEYGHFYKIIDTLRFNIILFDCYNLQNPEKFRSTITKLSQQLAQFYEQTEYFKSINFEESPYKQEEIQHYNSDKEQMNSPQDKLEQKFEQIQQEQEKQQFNEDDKVSEIRERLMKKKQEKLQQKEAEKIEKSQQQQLKKQDGIEQAQCQISLVKKTDQLDPKMSKIQYEYNLSEELSNLINSKLKLYYFQKKLLFKSIILFQKLIHKEWSKLSVFQIVQDIFQNHRNVFDQEQQQKIDDFMNEIQNIKANDTKKATQRNIQENSILSNALQSKNEVKK